MQTQELTIKRREGTGKQLAKRLRREGVVPAILYGGAKNELVAVDPRAVLKMIAGRQGTTQLLTLKFDGDGAGTRMAIIRAMQFDPVTEDLVHVDLQEVSADKPITVRVAIHPVGEAIGVKDTKGILNLVLHEITVSCLPRAIPERIDADVSNLAIGDVLTIADLRAPEGVRIVNDPGQAVATVAPPMAEEVAAPAATAAVTAEPEVLTERKPKEGEEAAGEDAKKGAPAAKAAPAAAAGKRPEKGDKEK
jgi:large subunit ribosomal protein L25